MYSLVHWNNVNILHAMSSKAFTIVKCVMSAKSVLESVYSLHRVCEEVCTSCSKCLCQCALFVYLGKQEKCACGALRAFAEVVLICTECLVSCVEFDWSFWWSVQIVQSVCQSLYGLHEVSSWSVYRLKKFLRTLYSFHGASGEVNIFLHWSEVSLFCGSNSQYVVVMVFI